MEHLPVARFTLPPACACRASPSACSEAHFLAATKLRKDKGRARQPRAILDLLNMAIAAQPDRAEM